MSDTERIPAIFNKHPFRAIEPIPELGIQAGEWIDIDESSSHPVCVTRALGPDALKILEEYFIRTRSDPSSSPSPSSAPSRSAHGRWRRPTSRP